MTGTVVERDKIANNANPQSDKFITTGKRVLELEKNAIKRLSYAIDSTFAAACQLMLDCKGRIIVSGMGKSGHIGKKIAATLASTGTSAFFVHPGEACHGDVGMIRPEDIFLAISYSGSSQELLLLLPILKRLGTTIISMTGDASSPLAQFAHVNLNTSVAQEACPLDLAPTASTTASLVMGDALAIALLETRGFSREDFAFSHPGGKLGRTLLLTIADIMFTGNLIPQVTVGTPLSEALLEISRKGLGMTAICDHTGKMVGMYTDGDLRRTLDSAISIYDTKVDEVMTRNCTLISPDLLASEALRIMKDEKINGFICLDDHKKPIGAFNMHNLLRACIL